jgi:cytochrome c
METTPIPRDIPLPLPANPYFLHILLVFAFIAHILFVNLMVGGSILVLGFQIRGLKRPDFDRLARCLATTVTVNKSLAVVLGVAPLLLINVLYTIHFYTANALTGTAWILLIPGISITFLLLYVHKYSWDRLQHQRAAHIGILSIAVALFLVIPLVFLANVNLMMFPERWTSVQGFLSALALPNVFPRYFHFLCASLIVTSLFGSWYFTRPAFDVDGNFEQFTRPALRRVFFSVAFTVSIAQFIVGPLVLFTLPAKGFNTAVLGSIFTGVGFAIPAVWWLWQELSMPEPQGKRLTRIAVCLSLTVLCMAAGRHGYRSTALAQHRLDMKIATDQWVSDAQQAAYDLKVGNARAASGVSEGQQLFQTTCAACHAVDKPLVGPSMVEIAKIYAADPSGIVTWAKSPGKKRPDAMQMPPFAALGDKKLRLIADYMMQTGGGTKTSQ